MGEEYKILFLNVYWTMRNVWCSRRSLSLIHILYHGSKEIVEYPEQAERWAARYEKMVISINMSMNPMIIGSEAAYGEKK